MSDAAISADSFSDPSDLVATDIGIIPVEIVFRVQKIHRIEMKFTNGTPAWYQSRRHRSENSFGESAFDQFAFLILDCFFGDMLDGDLQRDRWHHIGGMVRDESAGADGAVEMARGEKDDDLPAWLLATGEMSREGEDDRAAGCILNRRVEGRVMVAVEDDALVRFPRYLADDIVGQGWLALADEGQADFRSVPGKLADFGTVIAVHPEAGERRSRMSFS